MAKVDIPISEQGRHTNMAKVDIPISEQDVPTHSLNNIYEA
jgi:hypothetical protein